MVSHHLHKPRPTLPKQQLFILALCRFAEPVALTSVFPYLPEMIESFNVPTDQIAKWVGLTSAAFSLAQCLTGIAWGTASDRFGRKPTILTGLTCTMTTSIIFGFSQSLTWAILARAFAGLANGNVGIIRTVVAELVPQRSLQPRAFSIMPLVYTVGSILGPAFGGALVHPVERYPSVFGDNWFFKKYPFSLPNLVGSIFFLVGLTSGVLFLQESMADKRDRKDYGLMLGSAIISGCTRRNHKNAKSQTSDGESDPLLGTASNGQGDVGVTPVAAKSASVQKPSGYRQVFTRQSNVNLLVYSLLAMHSVAFDQLLPIFMHHPPQSTDSPKVHLPFKFSGGFGIDSGRIGLIFTVYGMFGMFVQFLIFPPFARKIGVLNVLKGTALLYPLIYILTPFTSLLPTTTGKEASMMVLLLTKGVLSIFSFPCSTILLTNSASSLKILGTLNGVATSISALGRAAGPALGGLTFTAGVAAGYIITPWWTLAAVAMLGAVPVFWLVEMDGFGGAESDGEESSDEETSDDEETTTTEASANAITSALAKPVPVSSVDESAIADETDEMPDSRLTLSRVTSRNRRPRTSGSMTSPIGMGAGIGPRTARRYSNHLGATRSGLGVGGTSYH